MAIRALLLVGLWTLDLGLGTRPVQAAFEDTGTGARAAALAGGYVAASGDMLSLLYNPAGLATVNRKEITSEYAKLFAGLTDGSNLSQTFMGYAQPVSWGGTVAASWKQFSLDNLYTERTLSLGYGEWITSKVAAGFAVKQLYHAFTPPNIVVDDAGNAQPGSPSFFSRYGNSNTAYGADLGFLIKPIDRYTVGVSIQNFNEPNVALSPADHEVVSKTVRLGLSYDAPHNLTLMGGMVAHKELSTGSDVTWTGAAEKWWGADDNGSFGLRGSLSTGSREFQQAALGASYRLSLFQLDYAFIFNIGGLGIGDTAGSHRFSLSYRFGKERDALMEAAQARKAKAAREKARKHGGIARDEEIEGMLEDGLPSITVAAAKPVRSSGPGLTNVKVQTTPIAAPSVQPGDYAVPLSAGTGTARAQEKEIEPLTRLQVITRTLNMSTDYLIRANRRASADARLAVFDSMFAMLEGYVRASGVEMTDLMTQTDQLEAAKKEYGTLIWEGASATDRLASLVQTLETWLASILRARVWNSQDGRDLRYRTWLETALFEHEKLVQSGATAQTRLDSLRRIASRALDFERLPSEPIVPFSAPVPVAVATSTPVALPVPAPVPVSMPKAVIVSTPTVLPAATPAAQKTAVVKAVAHPAPAPVTKKPAKRRLEAVPAFYKVKEGDTLIGLAERFYGDYKRWREIYMLNEDRLGRGGNLKPGQLLIMPPKDKQN